MDIRTVRAAINDATPNSDRIHRDAARAPAMTRRLAGAVARALALAAATFVSASGLSCALAATSAPSAAPAPTARDSAATEGAKIYSINCSRCHGVNLVSPGTEAYDLRTFPPDDKARFVQSVTHGKNSMPPWQGVLTSAEIDLLWMYVSTAAQQP